VKRTAVATALILILSSLPSLLASQGVELKDIRVQKTADKIEVAISLTASTPYESFSLMNPNRLVLDFSGVEKVSSPPMIDIQALGMLSVRSALNRPGVARVVFNFSDEIPSYQIREKDAVVSILFWREAAEEKATPAPQLKQPEKEPPAKEKIQSLAAAPVQRETKKPRTIEHKPATVPPSPAVSPSEKKMALGVTSGYLTIQDEVFSQTYGEGGAFLRGELSFQLPVQVESFDVWTAFSYYEKTGQTTFTGEDLRFTLTDLSLALRYLRRFSMFRPFIGLGIDYISYKEFLPEDFPVASVGGSDLGYHVQAGTYVDLLPALAVKVHIKYNWSKTTEDDLTVNLGGVEYGLGLAFRFNL